MVHACMPRTLSYIARWARDTQTQGGARASRSSLNRFRPISPFRAVRVSFRRVDRDTSRRAHGTPALAHPASTPCAIPPRQHLLNTARRCAPPRETPPRHSAKSSSSLVHAPTIAPPDPPVDPAVHEPASPRHVPPAHTLSAPPGARRPPSGAHAVTIAALTASPPRRPRVMPALEEHALPASSTVTSPHSADTSAVEVRADKYHRSRAFGQTHRANALAQETRRAVELDDLRREHALLCSLRDRALDLRAVVPPNNASPHGSAAYGELCSLSPTAAAVLGVPAVDGPTAIALVELTALRRNMVCAGAARERAPPPAGALDTVFRHAAARWASIGGAAHAARRLAELDMLRKRWDAAEAARDAAPAHLSDSPEGDAVADEEEADARRGLGPRRCTRCKKVKLAGSGHGRSSCDDGVSVALAVPYPAPPALARSLAAARPADTP